MLFIKKQSLLCILLVFVSTALCAQQKTITYTTIDSLIYSQNVTNNINALKYLENKFIKDSSNVEYWERYAQACFNSFKYSKAIESIDKVIYKNPKYSEAYFKKAKFILKIRKDLTEAINLMSKAIDYENKGEYRFYRGIYYQMNNDDPKAIKDYDSALELGFVHPGLYRNYAILLLKWDDPKTALNVIEKAIQLNPDVAENYSTRAQIYIPLLEPEKVCSNFETARKLGYSKNIDLQNILCQENSTLNKYVVFGDVLQKMEKYDFAKKAYNLAIEKEKDSSRYFLNRGYCHFKLKEYDLAEKDYLTALQLSTPTKDLLYDNLSLLYFNQDKYEESIKYSTKRIDLNSNNEVPYIDRGLSYRKLGKYAEAEKDFNTSLSIQPNFFRAYGYRAYLFFEKGDFKKALEDAKKAISLNPEYGYGYVVLGLSKQKLNIDGFCTDFETAKKYNGLDAEKAITIYCNTESK